MDIIKRLQFNKNPKDIKSGSIIGAKNIMLDPVSSSITNEYGFFEDYKAPDGFKIVGCIPCNEEICIFLYDENKKLSKIVRLKDDSSKKEVKSNWNWEGGTIEGTFAYNYKGELIIAISEHDAKKDVPLKVFNLDKCSSEDKFTYNLEEEIPPFSIKYNISNNGNLVCGTYTFFIRFKILENSYTKWFQLTDDIFIIDTILKEKPVHKLNNSFTKGAKTTSFNNLLVNSNNVSVNGIDLEITIKNHNESSFKEFEIGYIIKRNTEVLGRLLGSYNITSKNEISFLNNEFLEEISINDFLEDPNQFYNVKNVINYNNRLYISNYKTYEEKEVSDELLNSITSKCFLEKVSKDVVGDYINTLRLDLYGEKYNTIEIDSETIDLSGEDVINLFTELGLYTFIWNKTVLLDGFLSAIEQQGKLNEVQFYIFDKTSYTSPYDLLYNGYFIACLTRNESENFDLIKGSIENLKLEKTNSGIQLTYKAYNGVIKTVLLNNISCGIVCYGIPDDIQQVEYPRDWYYNILTGGFNDYHTTLEQPTEFITLTIDHIQEIKDYKNISTANNNNRTLIPGQLYNFYIHFIRKDLSVTNGYKFKLYKGKNLEGYLNYEDNNGYFEVPSLSNTGDDEYIILPYFSISKKDLEDNNFIGFFISYEEISKNSNPIVPIQNNSNNIVYTNTEFIYTNNIPNGKYLSISSSKTTISGENIKEIKNRRIYVKPYKENNIKADINFNAIDINRTPSKKYILRETNSDKIYKNKNKILYQLTDFIFIKNFPNSEHILSTKNYKFVPGFYNYEKVIVYDKEVIISPVSNNIYSPDNNETSDIKTIDKYEIETRAFRNFSHLPLNAFSVKEDYEKGSVVVSESNKSYTFYNSILSPSKLKDFLELKEAYSSKPLKSYTNYKSSYQDSFDKTIYRSDIISDESLNNGFRHFNLENYKNIIENKGNITNIVGIGLYLIVHTEYSLFIFDRNNTLSENAQLQIPDTFDIDYKELIPSGEGFGGLKNKEESIITKNGYIWFDRLSKSIFLFDGKEIKAISADIHNFLKEYFSDKSNYENCYIRFAEDYISNRLIITIKYRYAKVITFSYSFDSNTFISTHTYSFDKNYKTYNKSYIFSEQHPNKLFTFDKSETSYKDLTEGLDPDEEIETSSIDIIFTDKYELPKVLNSISYILSNQEGEGTILLDSNIIDKYFNTEYWNKKHLNKNYLYSGYKLIISSDLSYSGILDISKSDKVNDINTNKPYFNNGVWNFNAFRDQLNQEVTINELEIENVNNQLQEVYKRKDNTYEKSDMRNLIIGKYFILRFIFERNDKNRFIKFETVDINISKL